MSHYAHYEYVPLNGEELFTIVLLPEKEGKFPTVICRSPYVAHTVECSEEELVKASYEEEKFWLDRGYAVLNQHCRGQGKSTGAFVPYIHEREDGLAFREWVRQQSFYNGELFLMGASYTASLHYATAPFEEDIKGAIFEVQDSERYRLWYRNGQMRKGHANWHFALYKQNCHLPKSFGMHSFSRLPLTGLSEEVLGDRADDFEGMLTAPAPTHPFWQTRFGGADAKDAVTDTDVPVLLTTGYNDFYVGGVFDMWSKMSEGTKKRCAMLVSPYNHGDGYSKENGLAFPQGKKSEAFGVDYHFSWFENIRKGTPLPFEKGVITYYRAFEKGWESDFFKKETVPMVLSLGSEALSFCYSPENPPAFREEGLLAESFEDRKDVLSVYTPAFEEEVFVKGKMKMTLTVASTAPDTSFYARISIKTPSHTYVLRHDITSLSYQLGDYQPNSKREISFSFDEYAFLIREGECLRVDISSTDDNTYVCHTNRKGEYALQTGTDSAVNTVYLDSSRLILPIEKEA